MESQLTYKEFYDQVKRPVSVLDLDRTRHAFGLQKFLNRSHRAISVKCTEYVQGKPKLSKTSAMASIGLTKLNGPLVLVCFSLKNLYVRGVLVRARFYEMKENEQALGLVMRSAPLGKKGESYKVFGTLPPIILKAEGLDDLYHNCLKLGTLRQDLASVVYGLGLFALTVIEPLRQLTIQRSLVGESGRNKSGTEYTNIESEDEEYWDLIHKWDKKSLMCQGLKKIKNEVCKQVREDSTLDPAQIWDALQEVLIINSNRKVTYS